MGRIEELYNGKDGQERSARVRTQECDITRALCILYPLDLTKIDESNPDETAEDLRENNTSVVEMSENKNDPNLSNDYRPRRKAFNKALKCLKIHWTLIISTKKNLCPWGVCRELQIKLTHTIMSIQKLTYCFSTAKSKRMIYIFLNEIFHSPELQLESTPLSSTIQTLQKGIYKEFQVF